MLTQEWERCRCYLLHVGSLGFVPYLCMLIPSLIFHLLSTQTLSQIHPPCKSLPVHAQKASLFRKIKTSPKYFYNEAFAVENHPMWDVLCTVLRCFLEAKPCSLIYCLHWNSSRVKVWYTIELFGAGSVGRFCLGSVLVSAWYWTLISCLDMLSVIV